MALKNTMVSTHGFSATDAYVRVECVTLVTKFLISFRARAYIATGMPAFGDAEYSCAYDLDGANPIRQAYLHLKTLPEFADATDC